MPLLEGKLTMRNGLVQTNNLMISIPYSPVPDLPPLDPVKYCKKSCHFLATDYSVRILDIGSGVGKFCLAAAYFKPNAFYYGVEQRKVLVSYAETANMHCFLKMSLFFMETLPCWISGILTTSISIILFMKI